MKLALLSPFRAVDENGHPWRWFSHVYMPAVISWGKEIAPASAHDYWVPEREETARRTRDD